MTRFFPSRVVLAVLIVLYPTTSLLANPTPHSLSSGSLSQAWTTTTLITADDDWSGVPSIQGFLGDRVASGTTTNIDPQTVLDPLATIDVIANQSNTGITNGGVAEFDGIANPTVALQGSGTADHPNIILYLDTTGRTSVNVAYNLRDIDCSADNAVQQVALQYRVGNSGNFTNVPAGYVADATTGPSVCTQVTPINVTLPAAVDNQSEVQVRIITSNAGGNDEWVGVDDIVVSSSALVVTPTISVTNVTQAEGNAGTSTFAFSVNLSAPAPPGGVTFNIATADGTATTADNDYVANSATGATIPAGSSGPYTFNVTVNGDLTPEANETFTVNITGATNTTNATASGTGTITNDDSATLNISDVSLLEGNAGTTTFTFTVQLTQPAPPGGITFDIATQDNSATTADSDYVAKSLTGQTIAAGNTIYTFDVTVNGDTNIEPTETFFVNVTNISAGASPGDTQGNGNIQTDDFGLGINDVTVTEGNAGTVNANFVVTLSSPAPPGGITFDIATADNTATTANNDYVAKSLTGQTIAAGNTTYPFTVVVNGDTALEPNESFFVNLSNPSAGVQITDSQGVGTINNDDVPSITIGDMAIAEGNAGTQTLTFTVSIAPTPLAPVNVDYATADNSATVGDSDYVATSGTLTFNPGDTTKTFDVTINGDTNGEGNEQFFVNLTNATGGAVISDNQALGIIRMDDPRGIGAVDTPVQENFDTLAQSGTVASTPVGWTFVEAGSSANFTYAGDTGSNNAGNTYSYGVAGTNPVTDRALGSLQSGSNTPTLGAFFRNDTGTTITTLTVAYAGEEWRLGSAGRADRLDFQYSLDATDLGNGTWTNVDALDFNTPNQVSAGTKDGNAGGNRAIVQSTITGLSIAPGASFWIRYASFDASGSDDGLAVDDFAITANITGVLGINDVSITEGNAGTQTLTFTITRSDPAPVGGTTVDYTTADNTATAADNDYVPTSGTATIPQGATTATVGVTINGDTNQEPTESFFVNLTNPVNGVLIDNQGIGTINADDFTFTAIHDVQGSGTTSPLNGSVGLTVHGIVTGIKQGGSGGFFVQADPAVYDADPNTSEGIFIFTAGVIPAGVVIGADVAVTGTVQEFPAASTPNTTTEISSVTSTSVLATGLPLPAPVTLTVSDGTATSNINQYERFEGMRVAATLVAVSGTDGSKSEANATSTSNGVFYGVVSGVARPFREPGIEQTLTIPSDAPSPGTIPRWDTNPERIRVDSDNQPGATQLNVVGGQTISNLVGPLDFGFNEYTILPEAATVPVVTGSSTFIAVPTPLATELTVSSFNLERFYDTVDDPLTGDAILTATAFNNRLNKASLAIRNVLKNPDVVGVVEMENLTTLQALAAKINADNAGATNYQAYLDEGNDQGGIDVGFLVNATRVTVNSVTQVGKTATFTNPDTLAQDQLNDRPPLVLEASIQRPNATTYSFVVIVNHLRSLIDVELDDSTGRRVRAKRAAQAEFLANYIQGRQTTNPAERIISVGDFNAFEVNDGYVDVIGTIKGTPAPANQVVRATSDLVNPDQTNLVETLPANQRQSYVHNGTAQAIDHAIADQAFMPSFSRFAFGHLNADFPESFRGDPSRPERVSDHDGLVAYFDITAAGTLALSSSTYAVSEATTTFNVTVNRTGGSDGAVSVDYAITAGTATAGADFTAATGTVNFATGETSKTFPVTIANDSIDEADQTITLTLSNVQGGATLGTPSTATLTIQDDDASPTLTINDLSVVEGNSGSTQPSLTVTLNGATELPVGYSWTLTPGTATGGAVDFNGPDGSGTFAPGETTKQIFVGVFGDTIDEPDETVFVNLTGATNATIADNQGVLTIVDDDGQPALLINDISVAEGNSGTSLVSLTVTLAGSTSQTVTVDYTTAAGTASCCGVDFSGPTSGTLTFLPGVTTATIDMTIFGDTIFESNETLLATLSNATNATISDNQGVITINNDDAPPVFTINDPTVVEGNSGTSNAQVTVTLTGATEVTASVDYSTANGTATAGSDYTAAGGTLTFAPGTTTQTFNIPIAGDTTNETNETILANLGNASNASIGDPQGVVTITNDDGVPTLSINDVTLSEGNSGTTNFTFTVTLAGSTAQTVTVDYATANGTATAGTDYAATSGTLTFNPGTLTQQIIVPVTGETAIEGAETFFVNLTNAANATITDNQGLGTITNDDGADLTITTSFSPNPPRAGQTFTMTITVTNNGPADATNVVLTDQIPAGFLLFSATPSQGSCSGNPTVVCTLGTILNGGNATVALSLRSTNAGTFNSLITVTANETDPTPVVAASAPIVVAPAAEEPQIPTLSEWALIALAMALAAFAAQRIRA